MEYAITLIDKAAEVCGGSYYKLSKAWGVPESAISNYRHGKRNVPLSKVPKLAFLAGVDPQEAYLQVSIEQMPEGSEARDLLGKLRGAIAVGMLLFFVSLGLLQPSPSYATATTDSTGYTSWNMFRWLFRTRSLPIWRMWRIARKPRNFMPTRCGGLT